MHTQSANPSAYDHTQRPDIGLKFRDAAVLWGSFTKRALIDMASAMTDEDAEWAIIRAVNNARYAGTAGRLALSELSDYEPSCCDACEDAPSVENFGGMDFCPACAPKWFTCDRCHEAHKFDGSQEIEHPYKAPRYCEACYDNWMAGPNQ